MLPAPSDFSISSMRTFEWNRLLILTCVISLLRYGIMSHVYMLTSIQGQPALLYYAQGALTPETNFVSIAAAVDAVNDLLFYGGDTAQKPFSCLQRVERDSTLAISSVSNNVGDNTPRQ